MRKFLLALGILALLCSPAMAGKNAGGALVVHTNDANNFTSNVCNRFETVDNPGGCFNAGTQTNKDDATPALIWLIAAFAPSSNPGVSAIYFGLNHNLPPAEGYFANFGLCGPAGSLELPDPGWPDMGGNTVAYSTPVVGDQFFPFYFLNAFGFAGAFVGTGINPTGGYAAFVDDSNPPVQDNITRFGTVRWGTLGNNECPVDQPNQGACCFPDGSCVITPEGQCSGDYQGNDTVCDPNPCRQPEACCFEDEHCEDLLATDCVARGGVPQGPGSDCLTADCTIGPLPGACCLADGTCIEVLEADCDGTFQGEGTLCSETNCPPPPETGACCFGDGSCQDLTADACGTAGGTYQGDDTDCATFQCPPVATETTTWGSIKANYR
jgi:hypothetical protein